MYDGFMCQLSRNQLNQKLKLMVKAPEYVILTRLLTRKPLGQEVRVLKGPSHTCC